MAVYTRRADFTNCGENKSCFKGNCIEKKLLEPVNGMWSSWSKYGQCSRSCGGGIRKRVRKCDNPSPKYGGDYCSGDDVEYRSCNMQKCPSASADFR